MSRKTRRQLKPKRNLHSGNEDTVRELDSLPQYKGPVVGRGDESRAAQRYFGPMKWPAVGRSLLETEPINRWQVVGEWVGAVRAIGLTTSKRLWYGVQMVRSSDINTGQLQEAEANARTAQVIAAVGDLATARLRSRHLVTRLLIDYLPVGEERQRAKLQIGFGIEGVGEGFGPDGALRPVSLVAEANHFVGWAIEERPYWLLHVPLLEAALPREDTLGEEHWRGRVAGELGEMVPTHAVLGELQGWTGPPRQEG